MSTFLDGFSEGLKPDPNLTVSEWSDRFRILPSKGSAEPGRYRTSRAPFLKDIMDDLSPISPVKRVVFMKASQVGGSELGLNWVGAVLHLYPAPMMIVQPTLGLAERFSKQRVQPMIDETPELTLIIPASRSRDSGNSILMKEFRGGVLIISGSNSATSLRSMPIRFLFCDEISAYEKDVGDEGDPVSLAEKRTTTFSRRKIFLVSTPTIKAVCRIESEYERSDQRRYFVPCPHCEKKQWLKFRQLKWENDDPKTAKYECEECKAMIEEYSKTKMLAEGEWQATAQGDGETHGYHISALYSPIGWKSWADIAKEFLESKADAPKLKTFVNTILGETFEEEYAAKVGADSLKERAETYDSTIVPAGVLTLTAAIDVQDNRFAIGIYGWGREEESWLISHQEVFGDPAKPEIWKQLDDILFRSYRHELGGEMFISVAGIDTGGHFTHEAYQYVRDRKTKTKHTSMLALKGSSQRGKPPIGKPTKQDVNFRGKILKFGVELYAVGTDTVKSTIYGRLKHNEPGPGYFHFHADVPDDFFKQITSEKQITRYVKGFPIRDWVKKAGERNEALDVLVYNYACLQFLCTKFNRATMWEQLEKRLGVVKKEDDSNKSKTDQNTSIVNNSSQLALQKPASKHNINPVWRKKGFMTNW